MKLDNIAIKLIKQNRGDGLNVKFIKNKSNNIRRYL
jgi:hypothetical protein